MVGEGDNGRAFGAFEFEDCLTGELEKARGAGLEVEEFRRGGVLPADAFGGVDVTKFSGKNSAFEECGKGVFRQYLLRPDRSVLSAAFK